MKIHPVETELIHVDSQADKLTEGNDEVNGRFFAILGSRLKMDRCSVPSTENYTSGVVD